MKRKARYSSLTVMIAMVLMLSALVAVQAATRTLFVNGVTGKDIIDCGTSAVPCKTIGYTLKNKAAAGDTVKVAAGPYNESITIDKSNLSLLGAGAGTTSIVGVNTTPVVSIGMGIVNFYISGFTIRGGYDGIYLQQSSGTVQACTLQNNVNRGLYAAANSLVILKSVVAKANAYGMAFSANATGGIYTSTLTQNTADGLIVNYNAHAKLINCTVTSNNQNGVSVFRESSVYLVGTKVSYNKLRGLNISSHAGADLLGGNTISYNGPPVVVPHQGGICLYNASQVSIHTSSFTSVKDVISANNGPGIYVGDKSELLLTQGNVTNNNLDGVRMAHDSTAQFDVGASITGNKGYGIRCTDLAGDSKYGGTPGNLSGNTLGPTKCAKYDL